VTERKIKLEHPFHGYNHGGQEKSGLLPQDDSGLFRRRSLERLGAPDKVDTLVSLVSPHLWLGLLGLLILILMLLAWTVFGRVSVTVQGEGILLTREGSLQIVSSLPAVVMEILVTPGQAVKPDQVLALLAPSNSLHETPDAGKQAGRQELLLRSPRAGRVLEVLAGPGSVVNPGSPILTVLLGGDTLEAVVYVASDRGKLIQEKMRALISPVTVRKEEFGYLLGEVVAVSEFPASPEAMMQVLRNSRLVEQLSGQGAPMSLRVSMFPDRRTASGYQWSSKGPHVRIQPGTLCSARFVVRELRPIELLVPYLNPFLR
jgi:multidrug efflux pump subunit AcrA (membrane-fusion protein)